MVELKRELYILKTKNQYLNSRLNQFLGVNGAKEQTDDLLGLIKDGWYHESPQYIGTGPGVNCVDTSGHYTYATDRGFYNESHAIPITPAASVDVSPVNSWGTEANAAFNGMLCILSVES